MPKPDGGAPLGEIIGEAAQHIDFNALRDGPDSDDPVIRLLQEHLRDGADGETALTTATDRIAEVGQQVLDRLDFPPRTTMGWGLFQELREAGLSELEIHAATHSLGSRGEIDQINGWFFRKPKPIVITDPDDIDWIRGTGRFAQ